MNYTTAGRHSMAIISLFQEKQIILARRGNHQVKEISPEVEIAFVVNVK